MAADYRHIGGVENRLGRHYSRFSPFSPTPALADQSLALRKLCDAGSNRRSRARCADRARTANTFAPAGRQPHTRERSTALREYLAKNLVRTRLAGANPRYPTPWRHWGGDLNSEISIGSKLIVVPTPAHFCAWRPASIPELQLVD